MASLCYSLLLVAWLLSLGVRAENSTEASGGAAGADNEVMLEDAYESWLESFGDFVLMESPEGREIHQELIKEEEEEEAAEEEEVLPERLDVMEEEVLQERQDLAEEEIPEERGVMSPVILGLEKHGLLNPYLDYEVWLESQVQEKGLVFVTLNPHKDKSRCGLGGLSHSFVFDDVENEVTTDQSLRLQTPIANASSWDEISEDYWWAKGTLEGGSMLALTFTPPECGCLTLSVFFAIPVNNTTVVAGPYTFPMDMKTLFCVDSGAQPLPEEPEEEEEEPLVEDQVAVIEEEEVGAEDEMEVDGVTLKPGQLKRKAQRQKARQAARKAGRKAARRKMKGKKQAGRALRKQRVQQIREQIRQAGMRVTRWRIRQRLRQASLEENSGDQATEQPVTKRPRWARKQARKARKQARKVKKPWRRLRKEARKNRRVQAEQRLARDGNGTMAMDFNDTESSTESQQDENDEVNILLTMIEAESMNVSKIHGESENESESQIQGDEGVAIEKERGGGEEEENREGDSGIPLQGRRHGRKDRKRKQQKRFKGRTKKPPTKGMKFCCKFGIARKKMILNITAADNPLPCSNPEDVVATFAEYKFDITEESCQSRFTACCNTFTRAIWETNQEKKAARKQRRKQNRKARRQKTRRQRPEGTESA